jgi:anti-anti-sigma factor
MRTLREDVMHAIETGARHFLFNFRGCDYIDTAALGFLVSVRKLARARGGAVVLSGLSREMHTLLDSAHLSGLFTLVNCEPSEYLHPVEHPDDPYRRVDGRSAR